MKAALDRRTQHSRSLEAKIANGQAVSAKLLALERELGSRSDVIGSPFPPG